MEPKASKSAEREMSPPLRELGDAAGERLSKRLAVPDIEVDAEGNWRPPFSADADKDRWWAIFFDATGTRQAAVMDIFFRQLEQLVPHRWNENLQEHRGNDADLRAAFAILHSTKPRNEAEACLAAQLVALHIMTMKLAAGTANWIGGDARTAAVMARTVKAFGDGLLTMQKLRGRSRRSHQKIEVHHHQHQHVHLEGGAEIGGRPHATRGAAQPEKCTEVYSVDQATTALSLAGSQGETSLPYARRSQRQRGA